MDVMVNKSDEHASTAFQSFDTVRALHQSVLCLRVALENAHKEIDTLKKQISVQKDIKEGKIFREKLEESEVVEVKSEEKIIPVELKDSEEPKQAEKTVAEEHKTEDTTADQSLKTKRKTRKDHYRSERRTEKYDLSKSTFIPDIRIVTNPNPSTSIKSRKQMASKIDVKIKLSSNVNVDSTSSGTATADDSNSNSGSDTAQDSEQGEHENLDSLNLAENIQIVPTTTTKSEDQTPIATETQTCVTNLEKSQILIRQSEDISTEDHTKNGTRITRNLRQSTTSSEANEEVDDIELIFSSDDKEHLQEDLVSISDFEPNFNSDFEFKENIKLCLRFIVNHFSNLFA